jgi:uncharacterized cupin superfamily protein
MSHEVCDAADVEPVNGVFRPIRRALGLQAFGINQEDWPPNAEEYPDHDHSEDGQEEVYYVLAGGGRIVVDGDEVELRPGRYILVSADAKRKVHPGDEGVKLIIVGSPPGAYEPRQT